VARSTRWETRKRTEEETFMLVEPDHAGMNAIAALVDGGRLRVVVDTVFPLADAAEAHALGETGRTTGKIVRSVADEG
jgi:NADPH:quinone reductase-like Zn-dependent oxidoreductase